MSNATRKQSIEIVRESTGNAIGRIEITRNRATSHVTWYTCETLGGEDERMFRASIAMTGPGRELNRMFDRYRAEGGRYQAAQFTTSWGNVRGVDHDFAEQIAAVICRHWDQALDTIEPIPSDASEVWAEHVRLARQMALEHNDG